MIGPLRFPPPRGVGTQHEERPHAAAQLLLGLGDIPWVPFARLSATERRRIRAAARAVWRFVRGHAVGVRRYCREIAQAWGRGPSPFTFVAAAPSTGDVDGMIALLPDGRATRTPSRRGQDDA